MEYDTASVLTGQVVTGFRACDDDDTIRFGFETGCVPPGVFQVPNVFEADVSTTGFSTSDSPMVLIISNS